MENNILEQIIGDTKNMKPSILQDPFELKCVQSVVIFSTISFGKWVHTGKVEFKKGLTEGSQQFKGKNTDDVIIQIKQFLTQLQDNGQQEPTK